MRTSSLSEGITVTAKDREDLLADPSIRVGFEVEFVARFDGLAATAPRRTMSLTTVLERPKRVKNYFKIDFFMMMTPPMLHNDGAFDYKFFFLEVGITMMFLGFY